MNTAINISTVKIPDTEFEVDLLRLDQIHPTISGNKFFKLKYNIIEAKKLGFDTIITIGGNYSNYLHATSFACKENNLNLVALVTNKKTDTPTLNDCKIWGTEIVSITKQLANNEVALAYFISQNYNNAYFVPMGGDNDLGEIGAAEIAGLFDEKIYDKIICAVGTGTTLNGLARKINTQKLLGIAAVKDFSLIENCKPEINFDFTFSGFAKYNEELLHFMRNFYAINKIQLDLVYTAKLFWAVRHLLINNKLSLKTLCIHTGGVQGNRSINQLLFN